MPIYSYRCSACGHEFSAMRKMDERKLAQCPECDGVAEQRVARPAAPVRGKGSWSSPAPNRPTPSRVPKRGIDTSTLPIVGPDGSLYSADRTTKLVDNKPKE